MESNCWLGPPQTLGQGTGPRAEKGWTPAELSSARPSSNFPGRLQSVYPSGTPQEPQEVRGRYAALLLSFAGKWHLTLSSLPDSSHRLSAQVFPLVTQCLGD